jgi:hypothetical protein
VSVGLSAPSLPPPQPASSFPKRDATHRPTDPMDDLDQSSTKPPPTPTPQVRLYVNKLTSTKTQIPFDYYSLPYCHPKKIQEESENLGEVLSGDRIEKNTLYEVRACVCACVCACILGGAGGMGLASTFLLSFLLTQCPHTCTHTPA